MQFLGLAKFVVKLPAAVQYICFDNVLSEGVVAPCCNPLALQPEQSGGRGSNPTSTFERHDKGSRTRLALSYFCDPSAWR